MQNIVKQLEALGLSHAQSLIYLAILQLKKATVLQISRQTGLQRPTIYDNVAELIKIGLISNIVDKGKTYIAAEDPENLHQSIAMKQKLAKELQPELQALFQASGIKPQVKFFQGEEGVKNLTNIILSSNSKVIRTIGNYQENIKEMFSFKFLHELWEARARKNIKGQILFTHSDLELLKKAKEYGETGNIKYNREVKVLPKEINFKVLYTIVDDKVLFWSSKQEGYSFMFQSKSYANSLTSLFDFLWSVSKSINEL
ncbi:MAG TPA: helix-turn-helix domain-containing protein [Verrucomicrobiae bacterium]|nr:helix-turn-helix domain-containing protein [Verrucomicrobiae bacterium]